MPYIVSSLLSWFKQKNNLTLLVILGIAALAYWGYSLFAESQKMVLSGIVQAQEVKNGSRFGGRVIKTLVKEGDEVHAGDPLILFDKREMESKVIEAESLLDKANAQFQLLKQGADSADVRQAQAMVKQAEQHLALIRHGARPQEVAQAQAKAVAAESLYKTTQTAFENGRIMFENGIISQAKLNELEAQYTSSKSAYDAAMSQLNLLQSGARREEVAIAQAQVEAARASYEKIQKGAKSQELEISKASISQAKSGVSSLKDQLEEMKVKSPIDGVVSLLLVSPGEMVPPGRPVVSVIDYNNLWTDVFVPESKLGFVQPGQPVKIIAQVYENTYFHGKVSFINPKSEFVPTGSGRAADSEEAMFRVKVSIDRQDSAKKRHLFPGMKVDVLFQKI